MENGKNGSIATYQNAEDFPGASFCDAVDMGVIFDLRAPEDRAEDEYWEQLHRETMGDRSGDEQDDLI